MGFICIYGSENPITALDSIIVFKIILILLIIIYRPYETKINNLIRLANEILFIVMCGILNKIHHQNQDIKSMSIVPDYIT
jgi:hypothetical protein